MGNFLIKVIDWHNLYKYQIVWSEGDVETSQGLFLTEEQATRAAYKEAYSRQRQAIALTD